MLCFLSSIHKDKHPLDHIAIKDLILRYDQCTQHQPTDHTNRHLNRDLNRCICELLFDITKQSFH